MFWYWKLLIVLLVIDFIKRCIQYGGFEFRWLLSKLRPVDDNKILSRVQIHTVNNMLSVIMGQIDLDDKEKAKEYVRKLGEYLTSYTES